MGTKVVISKRLVFINSVSGIAAQVLNISVLLWLQRYLLKRISTEEYATYPVLVSLIAFLPLLTVILTTGLGRFITEAYAKSDERRVTQIVSTMFVLLLCAGLLVLMAGTVFAWNVGRFLTVAPERLWDARIMMTLMVCLFVIRLLMAPFIVGLYVQQKFVLSNIIALGTQLLRIAILLALLLGVSTRILWLVVSVVSSEVCGLLVTQVISRRLIPALVFQRSEIRWAVAKEVTSFGGWSLLGELAERIRTASDPIILNKLGSALDVSCFYLGSMPAGQIQQLLSVAQQPLMPPLTAMHATESKDRLRNTYLRGGRYGLWAALFLAVPMMVYGHELITLWVGEKFLAAGTVIILLLATYPLIYANVMMANIAIATAQVRPLALRAIVVQMINLLLTLYLVGVRGMGAVGSALGTFLAMILIYPVASITLGLRLADVSFGKWLRETIWPGLLPSIAGAGVWIILKIAVKPSSWLGLAGCVVFGLLCYVVVLLFCLNPDDRNNLRKVLGRARSFARFRWISRRLK
jgi:O-antigen/teichoic acid export membrane protein